MGGKGLSGLSGRTLGLLLFLLCSQGLFCKLESAIVQRSLLVHQMKPALLKGKDTLLPATSPNSSPRPRIPNLAASPLSPYFNNSTPKLSGRCTFNFSSVDTLISTTAVDCLAFFAPFLANVICCPQFEATLTILIGQTSKTAGMLALDSMHANFCMSDIQHILASQGAHSDLQQICSIHPSNLTEGSCPVNEVNGFESVVDSSKLLAACKKVDPVNECCSQICQNAILEAARKIASKDGALQSMDVVNPLPQHSSKIDDCRNVVLRWLSSRLDSISAKQVLRRISNCNVNRACPLVFPGSKGVANECKDIIKNHTACCSAMENYVSHLQKQRFITNLQALDCASLLANQLQKMNVSTNVYSSCQITLKDFSLQVGSPESGCLLPSLPSDGTFDPSSGISFTCDLNDNIAAPWPSASQAPSSACNKTVKLPALPAATSAQLAENGGSKLLLLLAVLLFAVLL